MAFKSIIEIDVQDESFKAFNALFERYQDAVKTLPGEWGKVAAGTSGTKAVFSDLVQKATALRAQSELEALAAKKSADLWVESAKVKKTVIASMTDMKSWGDATSKVARDWKGIAVSAKDSAVGLTKMTLELGKWGAVTAGLGLLSAGGGLFGINRLAQSAADGRRSAIGLSITQGQQSAFSANYRRYVDPENVLSNVATGMTQLGSAQHTGLISAGLSEDFLDNHDTAQVSAELVNRLRDQLKNVPKNQRGDRMRAYGLDQFFSTQDANRILDAPASELASHNQRFLSDSKDLNVGKDISEKWTEFTEQLTRAGAKIESVFITGLVPLAGPLEKLSADVTDLVAAFMNSKVVKDGMDSLSSGLESFAKYLGTDAFKDDVKGFADDIGALAKSIRSALEWLGVLPNKSATVVPQRANQAEIDANNQNVFGSAETRYGKGWLGLRTQRHADSARHSLAQSKLETFHRANGAPEPSERDWWTPERQSHAVDVLMKEGGLTEDGAKALVSRWKNVEARGGPASINPNSGAAGIAQGLGARRQGYTGSFDEQLSNAAKELNTTESRAKKMLNTSGMEATGASQFERAEGYDPQTGRDNFTDKTAAGMPRIVTPSSLLKSKSSASNIPGAPKLTDYTTKDGVLSDDAMSRYNKDRDAYAKSYHSPLLDSRIREPLYTPHVKMIEGRDFRDAINEMQVKSEEENKDLFGAGDLSPTARREFDRYHGLGFQQQKPSDSVRSDPQRQGMIGRGGMSLANFQLKPKPSITVQNSSGANIFTSAGAAAYG